LTFFLSVNDYTIWNLLVKNIHCAVLDACYARLYGLTRDELHYTLRVDPKEVHGEDFPGETFRGVLKEKEVKQFGEYRTRRLVLEAWDKDASNG
jgi:hypothetical protein